MRGFPQTSWDPNEPTVERWLLEGKVRDSALIPSSSNYVFLLELGAPGVEQSGFAVHKPERGETPLWDFPPSLYKREIATYLISEALGWGLIPPTIEREDGLENGLGSLQLFIPADMGCTFFDLRDDNADAMRRFAAFDWLTNNADRKGGHLLQASDGRIWGIDHGLALHSEEKLRTVIWDYAGQRLPNEWLDEIVALVAKLEDGGTAQEQLAPYLDEQELEALRMRAASILAHPVLPEPPTSRRPYPWPLI